MRSTLPETARASCGACTRPYLICTCDPGRHRIAPGRVRVDTLLGVPTARVRREMGYPTQLALTFLGAIFLCEVLALGTTLAPADPPVALVSATVGHGGVR